MVSGSSAGETGGKVVAAYREEDYLSLSVVAEGVLLALGTGLLQNKIWAQRCTVCLLLLAIFVVTFGVINPYTAGDMMMQGKDPSLPKMLAWIIPLDIGLLCLAWLLDPPRKNNKR